MKLNCFYIIALFLASCAGKNNSDISEATETADSSAVPREIANVRFFLETSASMEGYFRGGAEFIKVIPNLLVDIEGKILRNNSAVSIYYIADKAIPYPHTTQQFLRDISTTRVATSKSSEIHKIFEQIAEIAGPDDISLFVSDCILSFPDKDIRSNSQINREMAAGALKADIKATFLKLANQGKVAVLYGLTSPFFGTYYTYENKKLTLNGTNRPYYIWIIGEQSLVNKFNASFRNFSDIRTALSLDFGLFNPSSTVVDYDVFFNYGREGSWKLKGKTISAAEAKKTSALTIALDLGNLPAHAQDPAYLAENLIIGGENGQFRMNKVNTLNTIDKSGLKPNELRITQNNTHAVTISIDALYDNHAVIKLSLPLLHRLDYRQWSVTDDREIDAIDGKTFAFEHLVDGVREAYDAPGENYIQISIPIIK